MSGPLVFSAWMFFSRSADISRRRLSLRHTKLLFRFAFASALESFQSFGSWPTRPTNQTVESSGLNWGIDAAPPYLSVIMISCPAVLPPRKPIRKVPPFISTRAAPPGSDGSSSGERSLDVLDGSLIYQFGGRPLPTRSPSSSRSHYESPLLQMIIRYPLGTERALESGYLFTDLRH
ncbi:hypothetical protein BDM02DRAFT_3106777 [Thelephora ganbajun]|uniref:Uncharacterized protein n=1 Tax=Thelephora ganbajun TaxID=370292 RepID=A0ACB6ZY47_THEGA|nr:hypothetical protein BDM02DRAFT_3106777 [Thelephora ganbajun]